MVGTPSSPALVLLAVFAGSAVADSPAPDAATPSDAAANAPTPAAPAPADVKACAKKDGKACQRIGRFYVSDAKDEATALTYYLKACALNVGATCGFAATIIKGQTEPKPDFAKVFTLHTKGCKLKDGGSCNNLGTSWGNGDDGAPSKDLPKASTASAQAGNVDNALGGLNLGNSYRLGEGVKLDLAKATSLFKKSCDLDEGRGCTELGIAYYEGNGVPKDVAMAVTYLEKSCSLGSKVGCKNVELIKKAAAKKP